MPVTTNTPAAIMKRLGTWCCKWCFNQNPSNTYHCTNCTHLINTHPKR